MSNNRNRNRNRGASQAGNPVEGAAQVPQDKPFIFKTDSGEVVKIPAGTVFRPTGRALSDLAKAMQFEGSKEEVALAQNAATFDLISSGFPSSVRDMIDLIGAHELSEFTTAYNRFTGTNIPK